MTRCVSVLVPLMIVDQGVDVVQEVAKALGLPIGAFTVREFDRDNQVAVHINDLSMPPSKLGATFMQLEDLAAQNRRLAERYDRVKELMKQLEERPSMSVGDDLEGLMRKARKLKEVKQQNKKLRRLLQVQLDNTEKIREETQRTMTNLKDEFDALVRQMHRGPYRSQQFSSRLEHQQLS